VHSLAISTKDAPGSRTFRWKPALNRFSDVEDLLRTTFGRVVSSQ
jgi:hypothetical protein